MQCPICHGTGEHIYYVYKQMPPDTPSQVKIACQECGGFGIIHCCDGLQCQKEQEPVYSGRLS